jgi:hypothetical protein
MHPCRPLDRFPWLLPGRTVLPLRAPGLPAKRSKNPLFVKKRVEIQNYC